MSLSHKFGVLDALLSVLDEEHAEAVVEHRRVTIKKPLTALGAKLLAKRFAEWGDPNEAAEIMIERCWQGFQASWVRDRQSSRRRTTVDAATDLIRSMSNEAQDRGDFRDAERLPSFARH